MDRYRHGLLAAGTGDDDHVLETDIMRFLAIIGIVFWIIFSMIKSIPFQPEAPESLSAATVVLKPAIEAEVSIPVEVTLSEDAMDDPQAAGIEPVPDRATDSVYRETVVKLDPAVVRLEFESLDAMLQLVRNDRLTVYANVSATGFDLFFRAGLTDDTVSFHSTRDVPPEMWEIRDSQAQNYFINRLVKHIPSIRSFSEKSVRVSFLDPDLERRVAGKMETLDRTGRGGVLSVTGGGSLVFTPSR